MKNKDQMFSLEMIEGAINSAVAMIIVFCCVCYFIVKLGALV